MKKKFMENKKFRLIAVFLVTVFIVGGFSLAWFYFRQSQQINLSVSNFQATPVCYFEGKESQQLKGLIELSTNPEAENYIGKFRVDVNYSGDGAGYLRVRMVHQFTNGEAGAAVQHPAELPYLYDSTLWMDNRSEDYCYYYMDRLNINPDEKKTINLITGLIPDDESTLDRDESGATIVQGFEDADAVIKVAVEADMVQINRYPQIWGIDKLPWK